MLLREQGISDFVYDEERDLFRFKDGRFAFSRVYANRKVLEERGYRAYGGARACTAPVQYREEPLEMSGILHSGLALC